MGPIGKPFCAAAPPINAPCALLCLLSRDFGEPAGTRFIRKCFACVPCPFGDIFTVHPTDTRSSFLLQSSATTNMPLSTARPLARHAVKQILSASRCFSASLPAHSNRVPPESPSYIRLPTPPQSDEAKPPRVRGHLPVPREVFPRAERDRKIQAEYMQKTAPQPATIHESVTEEQKWKSTMAESRRTNLEESLHALWSRRSSIDNNRNTRVRRKFDEHNRAAAAPERDDDRLTRGTVLDSILDTRVYPDPERFARADRSRTKILAAEKSKREGRRDALMELYISASNFIVHETELKAEIEKVFADDYFHKQSQASNHRGVTENMWGIYGKPPSIANMMESSTGASTKVMDYNESEYDRSVKRQKRIAEDLTGGKME